MATRITITPEDLRKSSTDMHDKAEQIRGILTDLLKEIDNLKSTWEGASQSQFIGAYDDLQPQLNKFPEVLDGLSGQLKAVADTLEQTDEELATKLRGQ